MLEVIESVELAVSPNAESLSSSRFCYTRVLSGIASHQARDSSEHLLVLQGPSNAWEVVVL